MRPKLLPFRYLGGKFSKLDFLLPLLVPEDGSVVQFVEAACGSAAVALNYQNPDTKSVTINDLNGDITNFFTMLRDEPEELQRLSDLTPFSREDYERHKRADWSTYTDLERARVFYFHMLQAFSGQPNSGAYWSRASGMYSNSAPMDSTQRDLLLMARRMNRWLIDNRPMTKILELYGTREDCLIYIDPPYLNVDTAKSYRGEFDNSEAAHAELLVACRQATCMVALSGYWTHLYRDQLATWRHFELNTNSSVDPNSSARRTEVLWTNYKPKNVEQGLFE